VESDLRWLLAVFNWGSKWQGPDGRYLLAENPARGFRVPRERNPRQPVASRDQYETLRSVSDRVMTELRKERRKKSKRIPARSPLSEILDLAHGTGRRISAILGLRFGDLHLERTTNAPYGAITWPAETDKRGRTWGHVPIATPEARAAIDRIIRERLPKDEAVAGVIEGGQRVQVPEGTAYLFPAPGNSEKPVHRHLASAWLHEAISLADSEAQKKGGRFTVPRGWGWHAFRREAATELKGAADKDVMELLGWRDHRSLKSAYQHADPEGMLVALQSRRELREAAGIRREP
jgi:integrase